MCSISERTCSISIASLVTPLDRADQPFCPAFQPVVEAEPPEQDLYFTIDFHYAENSTKHERVGKPLVIDFVGAIGPRSLTEYFIALVYRV